MPSAAKNKVGPYTQFAVWLQKTHPEVFARILASAQKLQGLNALYRGPAFVRRQSQAMGDYSDYFSSAPLDSGIDWSTVADITPADFNIDTGGSLLDSVGDYGEDSSLSDQISAQTAAAAQQPAPDIVMNIPTDISSSIGSGIDIPTLPVTSPSSAASTVGSILAANAHLLTTALQAASTVLSTNAAANLIQAQANRAAAGLAPANVSYQTYTDPTTGQVQTVPVLNTGNGQLPLNTAGINALSPSTFLQNYGLYIMLGLAALVVALE